MPRMVARGAFVLALTLLVGVAPLRAQDSKRSELDSQALRISQLLIEVANKAGDSHDLAFSVRLQARAAALMWRVDPIQGRDLFRAAFDSLLHGPSKSTVNGNDDGRKASLSPSANHQLRTELLQQIAAHDPELAEDLLARLAEAGLPYTEDPPNNYSVPGNSASEAPGSYSEADSAAVGIEHREMLISVALQIAERDPLRALALGQMSLSEGVSPHFATLLVLLRSVDPQLADLLFSSAVSKLEAALSPNLHDIRVLASFLADAPDGQPLPVRRSIVTKFLNLAFGRIAALNGGTHLQQVSAVGVRTDEAASAYFVGRQLPILFALYMPERLGELRDRIGELSGMTTGENLVEPFVSTLNPTEILHDATGKSDGRERNQLLARAALAWLGEGDINEAQATASQISDAELRDRVLVQIARRQTAIGHIEDAITVAHNVEGEAARVGLLVRLAGAALASNDEVRARELLDEAEDETVSTRPSINKTQALLTIVSSFSSFDLVRAFEVLDSAVRSVNELSAGNLNRLEPDRNLVMELNLEGTFSVLAKSDFERALLLARRIADRDTGLAALLHVCGGALETLDRNRLRRPPEEVPTP